MGFTRDMAMTTTPSGLQYEDTREGQGASPTKGQTCVMHYTGWLWVDGKKGEKFDSSVDRGRPFTFPIGAGRVIKGWDEGVASMKIGGYPQPADPRGARLRCQRGRWRDPPQRDAAVRSRVARRAVRSVRACARSRTGHSAKLGRFVSPRKAVQRTG